jgi:hypothetical protein
MKVLTWAHKRHKILSALAALDSNVAARASLLEETWGRQGTAEAADATVESTVMSRDTAGSSEPVTRPVESVVRPLLPQQLPPQLAQAAIAVEAARLAGLAPAKPLKTGPAPDVRRVATSVLAAVQPGPTAPKRGPEEPVPEYLQ